MYIPTKIKINIGFLVLCGNEIKYVERQKKLLHLFRPCRNKRATYSPVCLFEIFFYFLFTFWK